MLSHFLRATSITAVQYISSNSARVTTAGNTITAPSGIQDGDLLVAVCLNQSSGTTVTYPSGFVQVFGDSTTNGSYIAIKYASSESGNYTFTWSSANNNSVALLVYRHASGIGEIGVVSKTSATATTALSITPSVDGCVVGVFGVEAGVSISTAPTGMTLRTSTASSQPTLAIYDIIPSGTSAIGDKTLTWSSGTNSTFGIQFSINPASNLTAKYKSQASASATATSTVVVDKPTGTAQDDILVAFAMTSSSNTWTAPAGWTEVLDTSGRGCFYKVAGASEGSNYTFTLGGLSDLHVVILCYSDAIWQQIGSLSASLADPTVAPSITTTSDNTLVIDFVTRGSAASYTTPTGWTDIYEATNTSTIYLLSKVFDTGQQERLL